MAKVVAAKGVTVKEHLAQAAAATERHDWDTALDSARRATLMAPAGPIARYYLGFARIQSGSPDVGIREIRRALCCLYGQPAAHILSEFLLCLGFGHRLRKSHDNSARAYRAAIIARPENALAWFNLANATLDMDETSSAARQFRRCLCLNPLSADAWNTLGNALNQGGALPEAADAFRRALCATPDHRLAANNLGIVEKQRNRIEPAVRAFVQAVARAPEDLFAQANLGRNLLLTGRFDRGWHALEAPRRRAGLSPLSGNESPLPLWDGRPLETGALLVWCEDKVGDEILFASLLPEIASLAGQVILVCNPRLTALFTSVFDDRVTVVQAGEDADAAIAAATACYPLEFAGRFVRRQFADFPPPTAYLAAGMPARPRPTTRTPRIGVCWWTANNVIGDYRSQSLIDWAPILHIPGIEVISLQYGDGKAELAAARQALGVNILEVEDADQLEDMKAFADLVAGLDLVISIPSTTVQVAGAVGTPVWMLTPTGPGLSWFWFETLSHSLWYPGIELFRQARVGDWAPVIDRVAERLAGWVETRK
jgi:cytochrome c-type biogenesis protein CcmH/NrfG